MRCSANLFLSIGGPHRMTAIARLLKSILEPILVFFSPLLRFVGALFIIGAIIAITADLSRPWADRGPSSLHRHLNDFAPQTLAAMKLDAPTRTMTARLAKTYLDLPAILSLGLTGAILLWLGRRRRQIRIYAN